MNAAQVINSKKVTDHHAIIPTKTAAGYDISSLPSGEQAILTMLAVRLICAVGTPCRYAETIVEGSEVPHERQNSHGYGLEAICRKAG